ncbi:DUF6928 family protein [Nocardia sp. CDC160]|uniref:DUF6928 family protein n=1 Tax=Nocardia sp. CDC160 TaxID=3112166 RepID=UPI002DBBE05A|nr:hypothetical protein [Nocardia sp. CDC160]MEC3919196.1 hypothetical protein [Nocardia sp. CDC160]
MGAKTAMVVHADHDPIAVLRSEPALDRDTAGEAVAQLFPGRSVEAAEDGLLGELGFPDEGLVYVGCFPGLRIVYSAEVSTHRPSTLPLHLLDPKPGRRVFAHSMFSMTDSLAFAVWEDYTLIRSLSLSPDDGVREDIGKPLPFEQPYWDGYHPVEDYRLPFHPLELGEEALRAFFGYVLEGSAEPDETKAWSVPLCGFLLGPPGSAPAAGASWRATSENGVCKDDPSKHTLATLLLELTAPNNNFLILERLNAEQEYIQTYRHPDDTFDLEYRDGGPHAHFHTTTGSRDQVIAAFTGWMEDRSGWRASFTWTRFS